MLIPAWPSNHLTGRGGGLPIPLSIPGNRAVAVAYALPTLSCLLIAIGETSAGFSGWAKDAETEGHLAAAWRLGTGVLGRPLVVRGIERMDELAAGRRRGLLSANPSNAGQTVSAPELDSCASFSFLTPPKVDAFDRLHEHRPYKPDPGGSPQPLTGWKVAMPASEPMAHFVIKMYVLDGHLGSHTTNHLPSRTRWPRPGCNGSWTVSGHLRTTRRPSLRRRVQPRGINPVRCCSQRALSKRTRR